MSPERLSTDHAETVTDVLVDAFAGYPVMRHVLAGPAESDDDRLRTLIRFFAMARLSRGHPVLGVRDGDEVVGIAAVTPPGPGPEPDSLSVLRERTWAELGSEARARYEAFGAATTAFDLEDPHHHLNMIGVRRSHQGRGLARVLLQAVHGLADGDPGSAGVSLTTETPANLGLYEHFGYRQVGHERVSDALQTWGFFRPSPR